MPVFFSRKKSIKNTIVIFGLSVLVSCLALSAFAETNTLLILDASGSMRARIDNVVKMDMAKDVICEYIQSLPPEMNVGLMVYGHRVRDDCNDVEYLVPLDKNNRDTLIQTIRNLKPMGKTPIALSLDKAVKILDGKQGDTNSIILVSDGKESCDADPCALIETFMAQGKKFVSHVIGFNVNNRDKKQLECIASAGKGKYYSADDLPGFKVAFQDVKKSQPIVATPVPKPQATQFKSGTLSLRKHSFTAGERIWVHFSTPEKYTAKAWIGIIPSDIPHGSEEVNDEHDLTYKYLNKEQTGDLEFFAPGTPGQYDFRMHNTDENGVEVASVSFQVTSGAATLSLSKSSLVCGEPFDVQFKTLVPLSPKAWVGIIPSDIPHGSEQRNDDHDIAYKYLGDKPNGSLSFNAPSKPGNYDMRLHDTDDNGSEIASIPFTVSEGSASVSLNKTQFQTGEKIFVDFSTPVNLSPKAWIGIIPSDIPHGSEERNDEFDISYKYLGGKPQGSLDFIAPSKPGSYDARLNDTDNNGNELASASFTVVSATATMTLTKTNFVPGERIWLTFNTSVAFASKAWVGIIPSHVPHGSEEQNDDNDISYQYVQGEKEGTLEFKAPAQPGAYDFRLNDSDSNGNEIASISFRVN
ncbi:MAG: VWA domain-containing protein [Proteobacteria bacterium]|nr:VWA domain-containing protein [Pseudomonadota bacterium]